MRGKNLNSLNNMKKLILLITFLLLFHNTSMVDFATGIATLGQMLGLPEYNISERLGGSNTQTVPSYGIGSSGLLGQSGYVASPVSGGVQNWPVSGGVAQGGPQSGQTVLYNPGAVQGTSIQQPSGGGGGSGPPAEFSVRGYNVGDKVRGPDGRMYDVIDPGRNLYQLSGGQGDNMSGDQYNAEVENAYNAGMGAWNTAEQNLNKNLGTMQTQAESDYAANAAQLGTNRQQTLGTLDTQTRGTQTKKEDAMAAARRLYSELQMGNRQRFGKATSAGGTISEIQGAELQRQQGQTSRAANETFQQIETARKDVESQYQSGLMQLQQAKQQALTSAQLDFTNQITQIAQGRAQTEQQKSQMRLQALMDLRNKAFTIQQQNTTFQQQLEAMKQQSMLNIEAYQKTAGNAVTTGTNAYNAYSPTAGNYTAAGQSSQTNTANPYIGMTTNQGGMKWDPVQGKYVPA